MFRPTRSPARIGLIIVLCGACAALPPRAFAKNETGQPPKLRAASAIMIEAETGKVLYSYHPDLPYPPASLTKMMTLQVALQQVAEGKLSLNRQIVPVRQAWAQNMPPRSSLMFLGPGQRLTVRTLLKGLIVDSGNDAAYEIAYLVAGSIPAFAKMMNAEARRLGFPQMHFVEPSGLSSRNRITAREYAEFCRVFIRLHPDALKDIFAVKRFAYPEPKNLTGGSQGKPIVQYNRNLLLWSYAGTDGFKTGYIDQSGYNMAVTAKRNGVRLIAVVLGVQPYGKYSGEQLRAKEEEELLNYGFANFTVVHPDYGVLKPVRVWKGSAGSVPVGPDRKPVVVIPKTQVGKVTVSVHETENVLAPVFAGDTLGRLVYTMDGKQVKQIPLVAQGNVSLGGVPRRVVDSVVLFFRGIMGLPQAQAAPPPPPGPISTAQSQAVFGLGGS